MFTWMSNALAHVDKVIRTKLAKVIRKNSAPPPPPLRKVLSDWKDRSTATMSRHAYMIAEGWKTSNDVKTYVKSGTRTLEETGDLARAFDRYAAVLEFGPHLEFHLKLLQDITALVLNTDAALDEPTSYKDFTGEFKSRMDEYAEENVAWMADLEWKTEEDVWPKTQTAPRWLYNTSNPGTYSLQGLPATKETEHSDALTALVEQLKNVNIPDEVVVYILTPTLANAGFEWYVPADFPYYVNFIQHQWLIDNRDDIWQERMSKKFTDDEEFPEPSSIADDAHVAAEDVEETELSGLPIDKDEMSSKDEPKTGRPPLDEQAEEAARQSRKKKKPSKGSKGESSGAPPPPPPPHGGASPPSPPPQPQVPDDSTYEPDPSLSRKVRGLTSLIQGLTDMDMVHDHMTRFGTTTEQPVPITRWQVRRTDSRTFAGQSTMSRMYVVTYSRAHRKPIFNPVD